MCSLTRQQQPYNKVLKTIPENVDTTKRKKRKEQIKICKFCERKAVQHEEQTRETRIKQEQLEDASIQASWQKIAVTTLNGQSALVWKDKIYRGGQLVLFFFLTKKVNALSLTRRRL